MVEMYNVNFTNNDKLYESRNDRQEKHQQNIQAHHLIQSFSPEDNLTPEEINRIGYETMMELTGGRFKFIVATHTDKDHLHNVRPDRVLSKVDQGTTLYDNTEDSQPN